jgi:hypothetical protein
MHDGADHHDEVAVILEFGMAGETIRQVQVFIAELFLFRGAWR